MGQMPLPQLKISSLFSSETNDLSSNWEKDIEDQFSDLISAKRNKIPWLSSDSPSGSLVKHYVMVQDILDQEFYTKQFVARFVGSQTV